jgi:hypothetical protein
MPTFPKLDDISIHSYEWNSLNTHGKRVVRDFVDDVNREVAALNSLIKQFNRELNSDEKIKILTKIYHEQIRIDNQYSPEYMEYCVDYRNRIHRDLFKEIQGQFKDLGLTSLPSPSPSAKSPKGTHSSPLPGILANMDPSKVNILLEILAEGEKFDLTKFDTLYNPSEKGYDEFKEFRKNHSIRFLGGGNSKNFIVENNITKEKFILKVDNRLGMPKGATVHLREHALKEILTPVVAERQATYVEGSKTVVRTLMITEFCEGGDLESHGVKTKVDQEKLKSAVSIYTQMGTILESIRMDGCAFPDMKNSNWLIDSDGTVRLADTKSFLFMDNHGKDDENSPKNKWYGFVSTKHMNPPEFDYDTPFSADKMHSYMLGKNLYQYLSNCNYQDFFEQDPITNKWKTIHDSNKFDFSASIFKTPYGKELKNLVLDMVRPNPADRISVSVALSRLEKIQFAMEKENCADLIKQIERLVKKTNTKDSKLDTFLKDSSKKIKKGATLGELLNIKEQLQEKADELVMLKIEKENCRQLLTKFESMITDTDSNSKKIKGYIKVTLKEINGPSKLNEVLQIKNNLEKGIKEREELAIEKENCRQLLTKVEPLAADAGINPKETKLYVKETLKEISESQKLDQTLQTKTNLETRIAELEKLKAEKDECHELLNEIDTLEIKTNTKVTRFKTKEIDKVQNVRYLSVIKEELEENLEELEELHKVKQECRTLLKQFKGNDSVELFIKKTLDQVLHAQNVTQVKPIKDNLVGVIKVKDECKIALALLKKEYGDGADSVEVRRFSRSIVQQIENITDIETAKLIQEQIAFKMQLVKERVECREDLQSFDARFKGYIKEKQKEINEATTFEQVALIKKEIKTMAESIEHSKINMAMLASMVGMGSDDIHIDKVIQHQKEQLEQATAPGQVQKIVSQLEGELSSVKEDIRVKQIQESCTAVLRDIEKYRFGPQDSQMAEFVKDKEKAIRETKNEVEAGKLYQELYQTLSTMKNDPSLKVLRGTIQSFRNDAHFYTYGMKEKAKRIEDAMGQVPIEKRKNMHVESDDTREVLKQLAANRKIGGIISSAPLKSKTTEEGTKEVIDEAKAASSFKNFKERIKAIQAKQEAPEEDEISNQQFRNT